MECSKVYGDSNLVSLLHDSSNSHWIPSYSATIHGTIASFDHGHVSHQETGEINDINHPSEKKRRLKPGQVEFLEKNFEVENKLEPKRKLQLAKEVGMEPRQVAIWFQNRRARFKIKQLEKDFECLKATYHQLMVDYEALLKEKDGLQNEVEVLTNKIKQRNPSKANSDSNNLNNQLYSEPRPQKIPKIEPSIAPSIIKQVILEDASSITQSEELDSGSPHCNNTHGKHSQYSEDPNHAKILDPEEVKNGLMMEECILFQAPYGYVGVDDVIKIEDNATLSCGISLGEDQTFWSLLAN